MSMGAIVFALNSATTQRKTNCIIWAFAHYLSFCIGEWHCFMVRVPGCQVTISLWQRLTGKCEVRHGGGRSQRQQVGGPGPGAGRLRGSSPLSRDSTSASVTFSTQALINFEWNESKPNFLIIETPKSKLTFQTTAAKGASFSLDLTGLLK